MKKVKSYSEFINESSTNFITDWNNMEFSTLSEKEVADVAEETLLSKDLLVIQTGCNEFTKLKQLSDSTPKPEHVLDTQGEELLLIDTPFEFLIWNTLGTDSSVIESKFILSGINFSKL